MIKLFRNIRQNLHAEGKTTKYFKYAIGEIILVVIGILIALSINNWNENRKNKAEEKQIITNLREEFVQMQDDLKSKIDRLDGSKNAVEKLMDLFVKNQSEIHAVNTDSLINVSLDWPEFNPTSSVLEDLLQSGRLGLIANTDLRLSLFKWTPAIEEAKNQYMEMVRFNNDKVFDYLNNHVSFKNVDTYGMVYSKEKSIFEVDNSPLFKQLYYENMLEGQLFFYVASLNKLKIVNVLVEDIKNKSIENR